MQTALFQCYAIEKPKPTIVGDGNFAYDPGVDPKIIVGPVQVFAANVALAVTKTMQAYATEISVIDPNRLSIVCCPISEIKY